MHDLIRTIDKMSHSRIKNYVLPGLTSTLVGGAGRGLVRLLSAERTTREHVTPHSHRFNFTCLVLRGSVTNTTYFLADTAGPSDQYVVSHMRRNSSDMGDYEIEVGTLPVRMFARSDNFEVGETYRMSANDIHSIEFTAGTQVLFFEEPEVSNITTFLEPWVDGKRVPTFKVEDWMFEHVSNEAIDASIDW